jgi:hypothetical protein
MPIRSSDQTDPFVSLLLTIVNACAAGSPTHAIDVGSTWSDSDDTILLTPDLALIALPKV